MNTRSRLTLGFALLSISVLVAGCGTTNNSWSSKGGKTVPKAKLVAAKQKCNYYRARSRTLRLLDRSAEVEGFSPNQAREYTRQAAKTFRSANRCMRRQGVYYRPSTYYAVGKAK